MRVMNFIVLIVALAPSTVLAQPRGGGLAGLNIPNFSDQSRFDSDKRFQAGLLGAHRIGRFIAVQGEIYYSELATTAETTNGSGVNVSQQDTAISIRLDYFEAPLLGRINLLPEDLFYVAFGGAAGVKLHCALTITVDNVHVDDNCEYAGRDLVEDINFAPVFGIGAEIRILGQAVGGDVRVIGGWEDIENVGQLNLRRAFENYSIAFTGRVIPVVKKSHGENDRQ
jgi:hypothetical protein